MLISSSYLTPLGWFNVQHDEHYIYQSSFTNTSSDNNSSNPLIQNIQQELDNYFKDPNHRFQLSLKPKGSAFQQKVWSALLVIPAGRTHSYGELAHSLQTSARAIGQACKTNPLPLFIPCHRIVGKGNIGGYMGREDAINYKIQLLELEKSISS